MADSVISLACFQRCMVVCAPAAHCINCNSGDSLQELLQQMVRQLDRLATGLEDMEKRLCILRRVLVTCPRIW